MSAVRREMREWTVYVEALAPEGAPEASPDVVASALMDQLADYGASASADEGSWSVQFSVEAESTSEAADHGRELVDKAAAAAGLPDWPLARLEAVWSALVERELLDSPLPQLLGTHEVAEALGVSRQRLHELRTTGRFPEPVAELRATPLWLRSAVDAFLEDWDRRPGRRRGGPSAAAVVGLTGAATVAGVLARSVQRLAKP